MTDANLTITYTAPEALDVTPALRLEQEPVGSGNLNLQDLAAMISLAASGIPAQTYLPRDCNVWLEGGYAYAVLAVYVWPTDLALEYELHGDLVTPREVEAVEMEREFDLVVPMTSTVNLPFLTRNAKLSWQTPCYNEFGETVARPEMRIEGDQLLLDAEVFGVLRFQALALGYRHDLLFSVVKTTTEKVTDIKPAVTARWMVGDEQQHERLELDLPGCLNTLLLACEDGEFVQPDYDPELEDVLGAVIFYSTCTGEQVGKTKWEPTGEKIVKGVYGLGTASLR